MATSYGAGDITAVIRKCGKIMPKGKHMTALITGASSGLGLEFAKQLSIRGYDIIAVARRTERLEQLTLDLPTKVTPVTADLSEESECRRLYEDTKHLDIDIVINNAGFGLLGEFADSDLSEELRMTDVNCKAPLILTKLYLGKFLRENKGYILNVCSVGGNMPGPLISVYYATKAYLLSLTRAVSEEIRRKNKNIYIGCVCPGPVDTEFIKVAKGRNGIKARTAEFVAKDTLKKMFKGKTEIYPGIEVKLSYLAAKLLPVKIMTGFTYKIQKKKL